jgi:SAM-dependent methyltransferase
MALYDRIGRTYCATRREDPRITALVGQALGDARSVINVGAGTGAYEPADREVLAVEPSRTMVAQRLARSARVIRAFAERLPFRDKSFDAALAVNTIHHWTDLRAGLRELRRVARNRVLIFVRDTRKGASFWLTDDYLPSLDAARKLSPKMEVIEDELRPSKVFAYRLPRDCADGLFSAYWGHPEMYLDPEVRRNISNFALAKESDLAEGLARLHSDLESGAWDRKYGHLRSLPELDLGHRILVAEVAESARDHSVRSG